MNAQSGRQRALGCRQTKEIYGRTSLYLYPGRRVGANNYAAEIIRHAPGAATATSAAGAGLTLFRCLALDSRRVGLASGTQSACTT